MSTTEDRVRAATRARTALVRDIRSLEFPDMLPAPARRPRGARRWLHWGAPIGAAALVTALALVLVMLRQAGGPQPGPPVPTAAPSGAASIPRYYVALAYTSRTSSQMKAVVGDDRTGATIAVLNPTASQNFYGVTAAADDRTFVVMNYQNATKQTTWYLLRLTPGAAHPAPLTRLPIKPLTAQVMGLALSPDGRELAVMWRTASTATNAVTQLSLYSMSSGAVLDNWRTPGPNSTFLAGNGNGAGLTWVDGDRSIDFKWGDSVPGTLTVRTRDGKTQQIHGNIDEPTVRALDVTAAGHDLLADSRLVMQVPGGAAQAQIGTRFTQPCTSYLIASASTVVCGSTNTGYQSQDFCSAVPPSLATYSAVTGKRLKFLYQYHGQCLYAWVVAVWTDPSASHVIASVFLSEPSKKVSTTDMFGLFADGRFTPLKLAVPIPGAALDPGGLAF